MRLKSVVELGEFDDVLFEFYEDESWKLQASCWSDDQNVLDLFVRERYDDEEKNKNARKICFACKVSKQCLQFALERPDLSGIYAGMTDENRKQHIKEIGA